MPPSPENNYQVGPTEAFSRAVWNAVLQSVAQRLAAREALEADFEALIAEGTQAALDLIQVNVGPQVASLAANILALEEQLEDILNEGTAPNSVLLGGQTPAFYLALGNATGILPFDKVAGINAAIAESLSGLRGSPLPPLDTLKKLSDAIGGNASFAATVESALAGKLPAINGTHNGILKLVSEFLSLQFEDTNGPAGHKKWVAGPEAGKFYFGTLDDVGASVGHALILDHASRQVEFPARPSFNGNEPWDKGNLPDPGWRVLTRIKPTSPVAAADFTLPAGTTALRMSGHVVGLGYLLARHSDNAGSSFYGTGAYNITFFSQNGTVVSGGTSVGDGFYITQLSDVASMSRSPVSAWMAVADATRHGRCRAVSDGYTGGAASNVIFSGYAGAGFAMNAIRLLMTSGSLEVGTDIIVEYLR